MLRPVTHFPLSPRSDDENYDVRATLHQCIRESIVRFFIETIVCIIKCVQSEIERIWLSSKITTCMPVVPGKFPTFMTSFLTYDIIPLKVPFRLTGHIWFAQYIILIQQSLWRTVRDNTLELYKTKVPCLFLALTAGYTYTRIYKHDIG